MALPSSSTGALNPAATEQRVTPGLSAPRRPRSPTEGRGLIKGGRVVASLYATLALLLARPGVTIVSRWNRGRWLLWFLIAESETDT
jgi:hypothetical protein